MTMTNIEPPIVSIVSMVKTQNETNVLIYLCFFFSFFLLLFCLTQYNPRISKDLVKYLTIKVWDKNYKTWHDVSRTSLSSENKKLK